MEIAQIETECPCTEHCELHGDCVACFQRHLAIPNAIFCHRQENLISGPLRKRINSRLHAVGIPFDVKDGDRRFIDRRLIDRRFRERRVLFLLEQMRDLGYEGESRQCERRSGKDRRKR